MTFADCCSPLSPGVAAVEDVGSACGIVSNSDHTGSPLIDANADRWRELYPIPLCDPVPHQAGLSTSARRRRARVRDSVDKTNSIIQTLNEMYGSSRDGDFSQCFAPTSAQRRAQHELFLEVGRIKDPPQVLSMREAVEELLQHDLSYSGEVATTVRGYDRGRLSIPSSGNQAVDMMGLLDEQGQEVIADPHRCMMLSEDEYGEVIEMNGSIHPYMDPLLRDDMPTYCTFIKDLFDSGMIEFTNQPRGLVTPFCVTKKSGIAVM